MSNDDKEDGGDDEGYNDNTLAEEGPFESTVKMLTALMLKDWRRVNAAVSDGSKTFQKLDEKRQDKVHTTYRKRRRLGPHMGVSKAHQIPSIEFPIPERARWPYVISAINQVWFGLWDTGQAQLALPAHGIFHCLN